MDSTDEQDDEPGRDPEEYDWTKRSVWSMLLEFILYIVLTAVGFLLLAYILAVMGVKDVRLPWDPGLERRPSTS